MTEQEWLACTDYLAMLIYLRGEVVEADQILTAARPKNPIILWSTLKIHE
jgi:hypothetical protein